MRRPGRTAAGRERAWVQLGFGVLALATVAALLTPRAVASQAVAAAPAMAVAAASAAKKAPPHPAPVLVDINSASRQTLKTLPGIGDAEARRIIAGRPYLSKADLVTEKILQPGVYAAVRAAIVARQKTALPAVAKGSKGPA
jgi:DNA uptake protein ComE-like DNA-binding protein